MNPPKTFITAEELLLDSFRLARNIHASGLRPNYIIGVWRGGTPPGIAIHEYFRFKEASPDPYHTAIKTQSYTGIHEKGKVEVKGLDHVIDVINSEDTLLLVDDVFDSGETIDAIIKEIKRKARKNTPVIKTAFIFYKPMKRTVAVLPDFYLHTNDDWLVFPHELEGLDEKEMLQKGSAIHRVIYDQE